MSNETVLNLVDPSKMSAGWFPNVTVTVGSSTFSQSWPGQMGEVSIKGDMSRRLAKKSLKVRFPSHLFGLKEVDLKAMSMEVSGVRELIHRDLAFSLNLYVQRMSHAVVYVNGISWGLYLMQVCVCVCVCVFACKCVFDVLSY